MLQSDDSPPAPMPTSSKIKVVDFLANLPLFKELEPPELDRDRRLHDRAARVARRDRSSTRAIPAPASIASSIGRVKLAFSSPHGGEKVVEIIGPGQSFGEAVMFMGKPYIVSSQALVDTMLLHVAQAGGVRGTRARRRASRARCLPA